MTPKELKEQYVDWSWEVVSQYGPEAVTYRLSRGSAETRYLKLTGVDWYPSLEDEAARMGWAIEYLPVPRMIEQGSDGQVNWLITGALPGRDATHPHWATDPERIVRLLATGLRRFHEVPVDRCPFDFRIDPALAHARRRLDEGRIKPADDFHPEFARLSAAEAIQQLERTKPNAEQLVVCHGDYCLPNVLVDSGAVSGYVDLGELGVADLWWDLAVATWSVTWNLGPGYEDLFLEEYGVERDYERIEFYRLLYDVVS
ncbi:MAG: aminoglycoside 3'-phosphotransferase [Gemmatimonadales bacterium]|jgi:kanamycin kinase